MSIRRVQCPSCSEPANVAAHLTNVRCPACGTVWNAAVANQLSGASGSQGKGTATSKKEQGGGNGSKMLLVLGAVVGALVGFVVMFGIVVMLVSYGQTNPTAEEEAAIASEEETIKPRIPEPYREVNLPEEQRKRIYHDYRLSARTSTEVPILMPQSKVRGKVESSLQGIHDRELLRFAALHNVEIDDIHEIIKEGDAKVWDSSPRSNAKRDGKRVYSKEMSEGWAPNPNRK